MEERSVVLIKESLNWSTCEELAVELGMNQDQDQADLIEIGGEFIYTEGLEEGEQALWGRVNQMLPEQWEEWFEERYTGDGIPLTERVKRRGHRASPKYNELTRGIDPIRIGGLFSVSPDAKADLTACLRVISLMESDDSAVSIKAAMLAMYFFSNIARTYEIPHLINSLEDTAFKILDELGYYEAQLAWEEAFGEDANFEEARLGIENELTVILGEMGIPPDAFSVVSREKNLFSFIQKLKAGRGHVDWLAFGIALDEQKILTATSFSRYIKEYGDGAEAHLLVDIHKELIDRSRLLSEVETQVAVFAPKDHHREYNVVNGVVRMKDASSSLYSKEFEVRVSGGSFWKNLVEHPWYKWAVELERNLQVTDEDVIALGDWALARLHSLNNGEEMSFMHEWTAGHLSHIRYDEGARVIPLCTERGGHTVLISKEVDDNGNTDIGATLDLFARKINHRIARKVSAFDVVQLEIDSNEQLGKVQYRIVAETDGYVIYKSGVEGYTLVDRKDFSLQPYARIRALKKGQPGHDNPGNFSRVVTVSEVLEMVSELHIGNGGQEKKLKLLELINERIPIGNIEPLLQEWGRKLNYYSAGLMDKSLRKRAREGIIALEREVGAIVMLSEAISRIDMHLASLVSLLREEEVTAEAIIDKLLGINDKGEQERLLELVIALERSSGVDETVLRERQQQDPREIFKDSKLKQTLKLSLSHRSLQYQNVRMLEVFQLRDLAYQSLPRLIELIGSLGLFESEWETMFYSGQADYKGSLKEVKRSIKNLESGVAWNYITDVIMRMPPSLREDILLSPSILENQKGREQAVLMALKCKEAPGDNHILYRELIVLFGRYYRDPQNLHSVVSLLLLGFDFKMDLHLGPDEVGKLFGVLDISDKMSALIRNRLKDSEKPDRGIWAIGEFHMRIFLVKLLTRQIKQTRSGVQKVVVCPTTWVKAAGYGSVNEYFTRLVSSLAIDEAEKKRVLLQMYEILRGELRKGQLTADSVGGFTVILPEYPEEILEALQDRKKQRRQAKRGK